MAQRAERSHGITPLNEWLAVQERELENFRAVLEWALGRQQDVALGGAVAAALEMFWWHAGVEAEGRRWIESALNQIDEGAHPDVTAKLRQATALLTSRVLYS